MYCAGKKENRPRVSQTLEFFSEMRRLFRGRQRGLRRLGYRGRCFAQAGTRIRKCMLGSWRVRFWISADNCAGGKPAAGIKARCPFAAYVYRCMQASGEAQQTFGSCLTSTAGIQPAPWIQHCCTSFAGHLPLFQTYRRKNRIFELSRNVSPAFPKLAISWHLQ